MRGLDSGPPELSEGAIITVDRAIDALRLMLREDAICRLEAPTNDFAVHAGFDLYMYIAAARPCPQAATRAASLGLFVDHGFPSPQLNAEPPPIRRPTDQRRSETAAGGALDGLQHWYCTWPSATATGSTATA